MPRLVGLGRRVWQPGTYFRGFNPPSDPFIDVPVGLTEVTVLAERNAWPVLSGVPPDNEVLRVLIELSMDGGVTWAESLTIPHPEIPGGRIVTPTSFGFGTPGGVLFLFTGDEMTHTSLGGILLPQPSNPDRKARVVMEVLVQLNTQIDVDVV